VHVAGMREALYSPAPTRVNWVTRSLGDPIVALRRAVRERRVRPIAYVREKT